eukprot:403344680
MYEFPEQKILAKLVHESPLFEPYVDVEDPREEERQNLNEQLKALHSEILKRGIFTAQQIIDDPEKFLISQQVKRDLPTSFLIKQKRAAKLEDLCCFCMTELAHGSNVQGIKTTATYDPSTREFVLNTPTDQDMKFWIGNLAKTATHGVVFAQLYTLGKNQGVHPFVVHLRDPKNHQPYPGLLIGDCGAKIGHHGIDNGFIKFSSYRISKDALLDKYFQVADDGTYTSEIPTKGKRFAFVLSSLSFGRTMMAHGSINYALYFLSTVLRYGHLRRQFSSDMKIDAKENTLMSYQLYQFRIVPRLARNLFFRFGMDEVTQMYFDQRVKSLDPKYHGSKMFHALITFCKSHISTSIQRDTEESRQALGGLGYSHYSEIGMMLTDNDVNLTWEGDNKVLLQQTAKFVLKNCYNTMQGKPLQAQELTYLKEYFEDIDDFKSKITEDMRNSQNILRIFRCITAQTSFKSLMNMQQQMQNKGMYQAYLESLPFNQNVLSIMFGETFFIEAYLRRLENFKDQETRQVFEKILYLWASYTIVDRAGEFRDQDFLSSEHIETCKQTVLELIAELKHELIPLTEIQDYIYTNVFSQPDAYDRFLGKVNQAQGVFGKIQNTDFVLLKNE